MTLRYSVNHDNTPDIAHSRFLTLRFQIILKTYVSIHMITFMNTSSSSVSYSLMWEQMLFRLFLGFSRLISNTLLSCWFHHAKFVLMPFNKCERNVIVNFEKCYSYLRITKRREESVWKKEFAILMKYQQWNVWCPYAFVNDNFMDLQLLYIEHYIHLSDTFVF